VFFVCSGLMKRKLRRVAEKKRKKLKKRLKKKGHRC
jgi:hypothetical protein